MFSIAKFGGLYPLVALVWGCRKEKHKTGIPRRQSNFLAFSASFTQCSAHARFHLQVYGVHDLWCKLLLCTTVLVQDAGAGVKNDSMVSKKLGNIFEMVEIKRRPNITYLLFHWYCWAQTRHKTSRHLSISKQNWWQNRVYYYQSSLYLLFCQFAYYKNVIKYLMTSFELALIWLHIVMEYFT